MRLPRDMSGEDLAALLRRRYGYRMVRQRGSHMTLTRNFRPPGPHADVGIVEARQRVKAACEAKGIRFLEWATPDTIRQVIDDGARVIPGQRLDTAEVGRAHTNRQMPV